MITARLGRARLALPLLVSALVFLLYAYTLAPTITWEHDGYDAGDLITAAYTLGIPHPTGYPTYMLLGKAFTLLPFGDVAYRMNLLSAVSAALTVGLVYRACEALLHSQAYARVAAACAALLLATSRIFWSQALITEVYALNCLFFATTLYLWLRLDRLAADQPPDSSSRSRVFHTMVLLALVYGLSLGNHLTMAFSAPLVLFQCIAVFRRRMLKGAQWAGGFAAFLLGLSIYAYLPARAGSQPLLNWGDPKTWPGFWWMISGGIYRQYLLALPSAYWAERLMAWAGLLRQQFGVAGTALGLLGAWQHAGRLPRQFLILLVTFGGYSVYAIGYNTTDSYVYLLPAYALCALWIAQGAQYALRAVSQLQNRWAPSATTLLSIVLLSLPLGSLAMNLPRVDLHNDYSAHDYGSRVFSQVPDGSIIISATDPHTFTLWYFAQVVTKREQVALIDRDLLAYDWYVAGLRQSYPWLAFPAVSTDGSLSLERLIETNIERYAIFLADPDPGLMERYPFQEQDLLYRLRTEPPSTS